MDRFKREGIPFTTSVIDMDWHRVDDVDPKYGSGWTGYSWNRELFPDPPAFLADLHRRGLRTTLNVHPRDGVRAFEDAYPEVAKRVGIDPATEENVEFDLTNRTSWTPISTCTTAWRPKVSTSGGWTGSRAA